MTKSKLLTAGLIAAAMLASPVVAREHHPRARHLVAEGAYAEGDYVNAPPATRYIGGRLCYPAPPAGSFARQPWHNDLPSEPPGNYLSLRLPEHNSSLHAPPR